MSLFLSMARDWRADSALTISIHLLIGSMLARLPRVFLEANHQTLGAPVFASLSTRCGREYKGLAMRAVSASDLYLRNAASGMPAVSKLEMTARVLDQLLAEVDLNKPTLPRTDTMNMSSSNDHRPQRSPTRSRAQLSRPTHQRSGSLNPAWGPIPLPPAPPYRSSGSIPPRYARTPTELAKLLNRRPASTQRLAPLVISTSSSPELSGQSSPDSAVSDILELYTQDDTHPGAGERVLKSSELRPPIPVHAPRPVRQIPVAAMNRSLEEVAPTTKTSSRNSLNPIAVFRRHRTSSNGSDKGLRVRVHEQRPQRASSLVRTASLNAAAGAKTGSGNSDALGIPQVQRGKHAADTPGTRNRTGAVARSNSVSAAERYHQENRTH
ncbi:hypothetical protein C8F01DRAFT_1173877, partial [Mycena amicta]